jgi:hypothetical protein
MIGLMVFLYVLGAYYTAGYVVELKRAGMDWPGAVAAVVFWPFFLGFAHGRSR